MAKELIYIVEASGLSNAKNKIANEKDKLIKPENFKYGKLEDLEDNLKLVDMIILEDEGKNQIELIKAISELSDISKIVICDNLDVFSDLIDSIKDAPQIITLDYKIGATRTTDRLPSLYNKLKRKFLTTAVVGYTNYALIKKDNDSFQNSADELTKILRLNGDSVLGKSDMNEKALANILFDRLQVSKMRETVVFKDTEISELKSEIKVDNTILDELMADYEESPKFQKLFPPLIGNSAEIKKVKFYIESTARTIRPVFIKGESGTGKELVAKAIHYLGGSNRPFVAISPAIPENLVESELFGHKEYAFTDAKKRKIGKFQEADGGVLFIDEIADISLNIQAKILRAIQEQVIVPVGDEDKDKVRINVKFVAATNQNITALIRQGLFREDLYHRLGSTFPKLPPLRDRADDIPLLIKYFLNFNQSDKYFNEEAIDYLQNLPWYGNVRQLKGVIDETVGLFSGHKGNVFSIDMARYIVDNYNSDDQDVRTELAEQNSAAPTSSNCAEAEKFLDEIEQIVKSNPKFSKSPKIKLEELCSSFGENGISRYYFYEKRVKYTPCIEKLMKENPDKWAAIRSKNLKLTSKPQSV